VRTSEQILAGPTNCVHPWGAQVGAGGGGATGNTHQQKPAADTVGDWERSGHTGDTAQNVALAGTESPTLN
jgi:hypothetical protein